MAIDPVLEEYLGTLTEVVFDDGLDVPGERAREREEALRAPRLAEPHAIEERGVPGPEGAPDIRVRIYRPSAETGLPVTVYLHGGGFVVGGLDTHDNAVRLLAEQAGTIAVSVDYRLAPEHRFPAAVEDAFAAYAWALANAAELGGDPERVAVAGDSAGGFLAACTGLLAAERGLPAPLFQLLVYPGTGASPGGGFSTSEGADTSGGMSGEELGWYLRAFLGDQDLSALPPYMPPGRAEGLSALPPTFILTAELDPLRADGEAFADRLRAAGVPVEVKDSPGMVHSFLRWMHAVPAARAAAQPAFEAFGKALAGARATG